MLRTLSITTVGLVAVVASATVGADPLPQPTPHPPAALIATSLAWCAEVETPRAAPELHEDRPICVSNEMPAGEIKRWARSKRGSVDVSIDRDENG